MGGRSSPERVAVRDRERARPGPRNYCAWVAHAFVSVNKQPGILYSIISSACKLFSFSAREPLATVASATDKTW